MEAARCPPCARSFHPPSRLGASQLRLHEDPGLHPDAFGVADAHALIAAADTQHDDSLRLRLQPAGLRRHKHIVPACPLSPRTPRWSPGALPTRAPRGGRARPAVLPASHRRRHERAARRPPAVLLDTYDYYADADSDDCADVDCAFGGGGGLLMPAFAAEFGAVVGGCRGDAEGREYEGESREREHAPVRFGARFDTEEVGRGLRCGARQCRSQERNAQGGGAAAMMGVTSARRGSNSVLLATTISISMRLSSPHPAGLAWTAIAAASGFRSSDSFAIFWFRLSTDKAISYSWSFSGHLVRAGISSSKPKGKGRTQNESSANLQSGIEGDSDTVQTTVILAPRRQGPEALNITAFEKINSSYKLLVISSPSQISSAMQSGISAKKSFPVQAQHESISLSDGVEAEVKQRHIL
ncbi:hypothetical protein DFH09DRAFT_1107988 [Mycena vulgaris]|nr:hypothetical protein DFH09DRAFT_1107988 [Mycena vulgaris]